MNDISVKIVTSPKEQLAGVEVSPTSEPSADNEVDPLAIEENDVEKTKDLLVSEEKSTVEEKPGGCDDNAKENDETEIEDTSKLLTLRTEKIKEELLKEDTISLNSINNDVDTETIPTTLNDLKSDKTSISGPEVVPIKPIEHANTLIVQETVKEPISVSITETIQEKEASNTKEVPLVVEEVKQQLGPDVEMTEVVPIEEKPEKVELKPAPTPINGDITKEEQATKRRSSEEVETDSPLKRLCQEVEKTFPQHDTMINDYIQTATKNNVDEIQRHTEQLLSEIQTLRELAQKKEHEWNNILHLKKVKEEILLRLLRRRQVLSFEKSVEINGADRADPFDYLNQAKNLAIDKSDEISGLAIKQPGSTLNPMMQAPVLPVTTHFNPMSGLPPPYDKAAHLQNMPKPPVFPQPLMMPGPTMPGFPRDMNGQLPTNFGLPMGRQGPTKDVKSIIADYRQRNPEITPRRGRRMKSILNPNMMNIPRPIAPKMDSLNSLNNLNMLFNNLDMNQKAMLERLQQMQAANFPNGLSFKDVLVQFANMQQSGSGLIPNRLTETITNRPEHHIRPESRRRQERNHEEVHMPTKHAERLASPSPRLPPPPPYPEISLLPVSTAQESSQASQQNSLLHGILTKNCGEITITPVQPAPPPEPQPEKLAQEDVVQLDDEESPASEGETSGSPGGSGSGRLVIDEGGADGEGGHAGGEGAGRGRGERRMQTRTRRCARAAGGGTRSSCAPAAPTSGTAAASARWPHGMNTQKCVQANTALISKYIVTNSIHSYTYSIHFLKATLSQLLKCRCNLIICLIIINEVRISVLMV